MLAANSPPPMPHDAAVVLIHDARAVHDTAHLQFRDYVVGGQPMWVEALVTPSAESGSATIPGSHLNKNTGELINPEGAQLALEKAGSCKTITAAVGTDTYRGGTYSWLEPMEFHKRVTIPEDYYSPFVSGGIVVFRPAPGAAGIAQFQSLRLIFPDWAEYVAPASAFVESHPSVLENGEERAGDLAQLRNLLSDTNKLLAVKAFRRLLESGHLDANSAFEHTTQAEAPLDAIFSYLVLTNHGSDNLTEKISAAVDASENEKKLESLALGAFSAMLFGPRDSSTTTRSRSVLLHVRARAQQLKIQMDKSSYLHLILSTAGIL